MATTGSFDLVMARARVLEDTFVADGLGVDRRDVRYNELLVLGPRASPVGISGRRALAGFTGAAVALLLLVILAFLVVRYPVAPGQLMAVL
ncbi:MAG TPA: hypothetical protein VNN07_07490 [Candidatus Tectomicrobia bacterium]|nr:hypothetical protein [Candidatus Tectomicrobia bacterium]